MFSLTVNKMMAWSSALVGVAGCDSNEKYQTHLISPSQARRLSDLTKSAVDIAMRLSAQEKVSHIVFTSRHGEIINSVQLFKMISDSEELSPTSFAQSVHNTAIGIYTLLEKSHAPTTAMSGGRDGFMMGLISCYAYLQQNPEAQVLYIAADEKVPDLISDSLTEENVAYVAAFLLGINGAGKKFNFSMEDLRTSKIDSRRSPQALEFVRWFCSLDSHLSLEGEARGWSLER